VYRVLSFNKLCGLRWRSLTHTHTHKKNTLIDSGTQLAAFGAKCSCRADVKPVKRVDSSEAHRAARVFFNKLPKKINKLKKHALFYTYTPHDEGEPRREINPYRFGVAIKPTKKKTFPCKRFWAQKHKFSTQNSTTNRTQTKVNAGKGVWKALKKEKQKEKER